VDSTNTLHLYSVEWSYGYIAIHTYSDTTGWPSSPTVTIANPIPKNCDPALFQFGGDGDFCLLHAPCVDPWQYIEGRTASTLRARSIKKPRCASRGGGARDSSKSTPPPHARVCSWFFIRVFSFFHQIFFFHHFSKR